jgi:predicted permease
VRSLLNIVNADIGVRAPEKILIGSATLPSDKYSTPEARRAFFDGLKLRLAAIPGIESVAIATPVPVQNPGVTPFELEGQGQALDAARRPTVAIVRSGSGYFQVMGATVTGREFSDSDGPDALPVAIVNRSFAEKYWLGQDPSGKRLRLFQGSVAGQWRTVVGVTTNIMQANPIRQTFPPVAYVPFRQLPSGHGVVFARMSLPFTQLAPAVRTEAGKLDADVTLDDLSTLKASLGFRRDFMDLEHAELGKYSAVAPIFAVIALLLAAIGLYAVIAHSVNQRTKEIGIRMALGGAAADIRRLIFREGMRPVAAGLILGLAASLGVNRVLQSQLVGVSPYDPVTLAAAPAVLILIALLACQIPSRRAMRVDPAVALRHD